MFKKIKSHKPVTFLLLALWEPRISYNLFYGKHHPSKETQQKVMECLEILSPIIRTHKKPPSEPIIFPLLGSMKKKLLNFMEM
jgi:hypothetical protein